MKIKKMLNGYILIKNIDVFSAENKKYDINEDFDRDIGYILESGSEKYKKNCVVLYNSKNAKVTDMGYLLKGSQTVAVLEEDIISILDD